MACSTDQTNPDQEAGERQQTPTGSLRCPGDHPRLQQAESRAVRHRPRRPGGGFQPRRRPGMAGISGRAGIPFYWIINVIDGQVEVYSDPGPSGYASVVGLAPPHVLAVVIDGVEVGEISVADVLP